MSDPSRPPGPGWIGHDKGGPPFPAVEVPRPKWSRRRRWITLIAVLVVVAGAITTAAILTRTKHQQTAAEFVADYLDALSHGSAADVLSYGDLPDDRTFLTDAVLHTQQRMAPITDVSTKDAGDDTVDATYQYGQQSVHAQYDLLGSADHWKLSTTTVVYQFGNVPDIATLFGVRLVGGVQARLFPGPLVFATVSNYLAVQDNEPFVGAPDDTDFHIINLLVTLSAAGRTASQQAVLAALTACAKVQELAPQHCPQQSFPNLSGDENLVSQSIRWTAPTDVSHLEYAADGDDVDVSGPVYFGLSYNVESTAGGTQTRTERVLTDLNGTVDLSTSPPRYVS